MVKFKFYSHQDKDRRGPGERLQFHHPDVLGGTTGENIAIDTGDTEEEVATNLVSSWMNSPGHRANILDKGFSHMGVGIAVSNGGYYGTQNFGTMLAQLVSTKKDYYAFDETIDLTFIYLGTRSRETLTIFISFPNSSAQYKMPDESYYKGVSKLTPVWFDDTHFTIPFIPKDSYGTGTYRIRMGFSGSYYPHSIVFIVK